MRGPAWVILPTYDEADNVADAAAWRVPALRFGPRRRRPLGDSAAAADPLVHEG